MKKGAKKEVKIMNKPVKNRCQKKVGKRADRPVTPGSPRGARGHTIQQDRELSIKRKTKKNNFAGRSAER